MEQSRTSAATSINAAKLPRVYNAATFYPGEIILDYGCGKYTDHIRKALPSGVKYLPFDPYNQPHDVNDASKKAAWEAVKKGQPVTVVCSNVLNVIDSDDVLRRVIWELENLACQNPGGRVLVTVYEGDGSGNGRETMPDCFQRNQKTRDYLPLFAARAVIRRGIISETF